MNNIKQVKKIKWEKILTRKNSVFMDYMKLFGASRIFLRIGYDYRVRNYKVVNGHNYVDQNYSRHADILKNQLTKNPALLKNILNSGFSQAKIFKKEWRQIGRVKTKNLSDRQLKKLFDQYMNSLYKLMAFLFSPLFAEKILADKVSEIIEKNAGKSKVSTLLSLVASPEKLSSIQLENIDFLKMMQKIRADRANRTKLIANHLSKWAWLGDHNFWGDFWKLADISSRIKNSNIKNFTREIDTIKNNLTNTKKEYRIITNKWKLTSAERNILRLAKDYVYFRTFRLDLLFYSEFLVQNIFSEIAQRLDLNLHDLFMLTPTEISNSILSKRVDRKIISARKESYAIVLKDYIVNEYSGAATKRFEESEKETEMPQEIKGSPAYLGLVKGRVRIIMDKSDFIRFKTGEILVTPMTTPDFVPLMKRCAAIVTDEGGITCHAAIVSREMKKPCIIGTRNATKILKDGDFIEVNANKGIIRITRN